MEGESDLWSCHMILKAQFPINYKTYKEMGGEEQSMETVLEEA